MSRYLARDPTGVRYSTKTKGDKLYLVSNLPLGTCRLQVSKIGFNALNMPDAVLNVQDVLTSNSTLSIEW